VARRTRLLARRAALIAVTLAGVAPVPEAGAADELLVQNGTGMRVVDTANTPIGTAIPDARFGHWSRDGARVIANVGQNVVVMDADGSNRRVVATGWFDPVFSPDGRRWAGWRIASGAIQFGVGSVSGGPVTPIPNLSNLYMSTSGKLIAWSAQDEIAFAYYPDPNDGNTRAIGVIHPDGSGFRHLLTLPVPPKPQPDDSTYNLPNDLAFSPDGKTLAVPHEISYGRIGTRDDPFQYDYDVTTLAVQPGGTATDRTVGTAQQPTSGGTQVTGVRPFGASFAPDGNRIALTGDGGDHSKISIYGLDTGSLSPIAARTAVKARWRPTVTDTDGDGLLDDWEKNGIDTDGNGQVDLDLPAMGADFEHKDVFVELDYMPPHRLEQSAIDDVVTAFANSPVTNPDGIGGVTLHVDNGANSVMNPVSGALWGALSDQDSISHQNTLGTTVGGNYDWSAFDTLKTANFDDARKAAFHYAISAHAHHGTYSGVSRDIGASDFLVTLGAGCESLRGSDCTLNAREQAGTFMHELGHNLGLRHGGDDDDSYKPSHLSVMNYTFQLTWLVHTDLTRELDYSRHGFAMNEAGLNETTGFGFPAGSPQAAYLTEVQCATEADTRKLVWKLATSKVDFNCDGTKAGVVSVDTNDDGQVSAWGAHAEWPTLIFKGGQVGDLGAQVLPDESVVEEADVAELLQSNEVFESFVPEDPGGGDPGGGDPGGDGPGGGNPGGGGPGGGGPATAPELSGLVIRPSGFRAAPRGGSIGRRGASVRYTLTAAATVRLKIDKLVSGRRRAGRCVPPKRAPRGRACTRAVPVRGSFSHAGTAGANSFTFTGRLGGRALRPGRYRLTATPVGADGLAGAPKQAQLRVLTLR
jgi:hypothetical protein